MKGFPTLKMMYPDGKGGVAEVPYKSARTLDALYNFAVSASVDPVVSYTIVLRVSRRPLWRGALSDGRTL